MLGDRHVIYVCLRVLLLSVSFSTLCGGDAYTHAQTKNISCNPVLLISGLISQSHAGRDSRTGTGYSWTPSKGTQQGCPLSATLFGFWMACAAHCSSYGRCHDFTNTAEGAGLYATLLLPCWGSCCLLTLLLCEGRSMPKLDFCIV